MEKMLKVKRSNELQQEIESCRAKATEVEIAMQPLIDESFELITAVDTQLKVLKEYDAFAQQKTSEASAAALQKLIEKSKQPTISCVPSTRSLLSSLKNFSYQRSSRVSQDGPLVSLRGLLGRAP